MLWVKFGSVVIILLIVVLATLGGREFFQYFDVSIHKKTESADLPLTGKNVSNDAKKSESASEESEDTKKSDKEWSEFH
jgi:hypothetical protein